MRKSETKESESKEAKLSFGRYTVLQVLGQGAMATVYLANDPNLNRLVAIKVMHGHLDSNKTVRTRFWLEAQAVASLRNPHIVEIFDYAEKDGNPYIVMEFVDGNNLGKILDRLGIEPMPQTIAASLVCQAAEALTVAKKHSIVHRDIKPENMIVDVQGYLKVADFGIAQMSHDTLTRTGNLVGTPTYMSPEQVLGRGRITFQSDMFSLGIVFYRLLTGSRPFNAENIPAVMRKILEDVPVPVRNRNPSVDPLLSDLVDTLLKKDPGQRGDGPDWLLSELQRYLVKRTVTNPIQKVKSFVDGVFAVGPNFKTAREIDMLAVEIEKKKQADIKTWSATAPATGFGMSLRKTFASYNREGKLMLFGSIAAALAGLGGMAFFLSGSLLNVITSQDKRGKDVKPVFHSAVPDSLPLKTEVTPKELLPLPVQTIQNGLPKEPERKPAPVKPKARVQRPRIVSPNEKPRELAPPPAARLKVDINSTPPFAEIVVNGESWGMTPIHQKEILSGKYHFQISFGTHSLDTLVQVQPGMPGLWFNDR